MKTVTTPEQIREMEFTEIECVVIADALSDWYDARENKDAPLTKTAENLLERFL